MLKETIRILLYFSFVLMHVLATYLFKLNNNSLYKVYHCETPQIKNKILLHSNIRIH